MSLRIKVPLVLPLVALLAGGCTEEVDQTDPPQAFAVATFDSTTGVIPLPNDLALQAAPAQTNPTARATLFSFIDANGFPPLVAPGQPLPIAVPIRVMQRNPDTGAYAPAGVPAGIQADTVNAGTVAIVRVSGEGAPQVVAPLFVGFAAQPPLVPVPSLIVVPQTGYVPGSRYVVAVRGGENGIRTTEGLQLGAEAPIALILPNENLNFVENQPLGGLPQAQVAQLETIRALYAAPIDWNTVRSAATCAAAYGLPAAAFPEGMCWLPPLPPGTLTPGVTPAFDAIDLVFPRTEAASIQVFEIAPAAG